MTLKRFPVLAVFAAVLLSSAVFTVSGQPRSDGHIANMSAGAGGVRWDTLVPNDGGTLTITFPDGRAFRKRFPAGAGVEIRLGEKQLESLPDGVYTYELQLTPVISLAAKEALTKGRGKDDDPESERMARKPSGASLVVSGSFAIVNGSFVGPGATESQRSNAKSTEPRRMPASSNTVARLFNHRMSLGAMFDFVIADDLIVQGSACVGLDCVNGEVFGFDTIRNKENNTRIQFDDTSTSAGFATNNWQIRANSSANGGGSFLAFVDQGATGNSESGTIVFEVDAGAPANSLRVSSGGNVGIGTATPVLDVHANTTDTPAMRFEQNNSGGFTAQTWDVAGNEANFFVRDVTSGSLLPFRIRPGAPTSSIDISAAGNVGIGTSSPIVRLHSVVTSTNTALPPVAADIGFAISNSDTTANNLSILSFANSANGGQAQIGSINLGSTSTAGGHMIFLTRPAGGAIAERMRLTSAGRLGIGTNAPDQALSVIGDASKSVGGGSWQVFSDERLKTINGRFSRGLSAVMRLQPVRFHYKPDNGLGLTSEGERIGFGAQTLQKIVPEAVTRNSDGYLMVNNDPILWTMLNAIKEQQKEIEDLKGQIRKLQNRRTPSRRK